MTKEEVLTALKHILIFCTDCEDDKVKVKSVIESVKKQTEWVE